MNELEFKAGDFVRLKSGGPTMTVEQVGKSLGDDAVWCVWFEKTKKHSDTFAPLLLEKTKMPTASSGVFKLG